VTVAEAAPPTFQPWWVQNFLPTDLWSALSDPAVDYGAVPQWSYLLVVAPQAGPRLSVFVPWTKNYAYVDARSVGPSGAPPAEWLAVIAPDPAKSVASAAAWLGRVVANGLVERQAPTARSATRFALPAGTPVQVVNWVVGDELTSGDWTWAKLADGSYAYGESLQIVRPGNPPPIPQSHPAGQWIDVNLLQQTAVAYQDATPLYLAIVSTGSPGWETPVGLHSIERRVADETMVGATLSPLGLDTWQLAHLSYDISDVLDTQYFDDLGDALHENYWLPSTRFGVPHSHGCVGMQRADAEWFWNWAAVGTPVLVQPR
jgi:lipoprotein-anchoring transpeptidase ErfK/SrfK